MDWLSAVEQLRRDGSSGVLVTVIKVRGHAPRDAGAKMVVGADHTWGSVGGGNLEESAVRRARELIAAGGLMSYGSSLADMFAKWAFTLERFSRVQTRPSCLCCSPSNSRWQST